MNLKDKTESALKADAMILRGKKDDLEATGKQGTTVYNDCVNMLDEYERELWLRQPGQPLSMPGSHLNSSSASRGKTIFGSIGDQLRAVHAAEVPGGRVDQRLFNVASGLNETTPSDGGFLIEQQFSAELLQASYGVGKVAPLCRKITIGGNSNGIKIPGLDETSRATGSRWGGVRSYWLAEADEKIASKPKFRQISLELKKAAVLIYATDELLQDSSILANVISTVARDELSFTMDDAVINGTGAGRPLGVLNSGALVTQDAVSGQGTGTIIYQNIMDMWTRLLPGAREKAVWLINQDIEPQLYAMSLTVGTGGSAVFMPAGGASSTPYATLFGKPIIPCEQCATLGTAGDIILGDFSNGYILAGKGGVKADMSIHVRFVYDESVFRFVLRIDGQPILSQPITPYKGSATQSHFVVLNSTRT